MTALARLLLFLSSYVPLFVVFALLDSFGKGWPTGACLILAALGLVALPLVFLVTHNLEPQRLKAETSQVRDGDALAYIATYLVPFAATTATTGREPRSSRAICLAHRRPLCAGGTHLYQPAAGNRWLPAVPGRNTKWRFGRAHQPEAISGLRYVAGRAPAR